MTKKSLARQQRDRQKKQAQSTQNQELDQAFLENNSSWDDLISLYKQLSTMLVSNLRMLVDTMQVPGVITYLEQSEFSETVILFNGIQRDFDTLAADLKAIYEKHQDKTGAVKDIDDFVDSIGIFEGYNNFMMRYDQIITPVYNQIVEKAGMALSKIQEAIQSEKVKHEAQDVSIVTDLAVKEPTAQ